MATTSGLSAVQKKLADAARRYKEAVAASQYVEGVDLLRKAQALTPVATGALKASVFLKSIVNGKGGPRTKVGFSSPYAFLQHSHVEWKHLVGQAMFVADPLKTLQAGYTKRVAERAKVFFDTGLGIGMRDIFPKVMSPRQRKSATEKAYQKTVKDKSRAKRAARRGARGGR